METKLNKFFSIITICYNEPDLDKTCQSIINQTTDNYEWIVIDGSSNQETLNIFKKYQDKINYFVSEKDNGRFDAMNKGIDKTQGDWLILYECSDINCYLFI